MRNIILLVFIFFNSFPGLTQPNKKYVQDGRGFIFSNVKNERLRLTPYGNFIIRVQVARPGEDFFPDDRYEIIETHEWPGKLKLLDSNKYLQVSTRSKDAIEVTVNKENLSLSFSLPTDHTPFLTESKETLWEADSISTSFIFDNNEHFTGLGHDYFGRQEKLDLKGESVKRNYGTAHGQQAPLIVPFYISNKGYGIFLNSTFPNSFNFGKDGQYNFSIAGPGQMDFFVILGPAFSKIIDLYTQLTGRPRFPPKAIFGLALSDKANDHLSAAPSDEKWWKEKITAHRDAGFPIDHIINDNRWRAGGGERCRSYFEWDKTRFPDPHEYEEWIRSKALYTTLDFNRCIASKSEGWKTSFNIPGSDSIDFNESAPDFTKKEVREWFWELQWKKTLDTTLGYPGDALWIDEFDEMGKIPSTVKLSNGSTWLEMKNYWFFLIAKSLVQEGWDKKFHGTKRPFVWVRGMTAGAQRYATLWSGDIKPTYDEMKNQVHGMLLAGISGFPFWGHDAGGYYDWENNKGPNDSLYRQWSMAFGSFTPFWKPHGPGQSRWPLDRSADAQKDAKTYCILRYELIPYLYTYAHKSNETGMPVARAMMLDHPADSLAWKSDLQYMWGDEILVAPNCSDGNNVSVWLPNATWYDFWNDKQIKGNQVISYPSPIGKLPLFIRSGSIIPMANYALSTSLISIDSITIHVYTGGNGKFSLYEDDGISEAYKEKNESRITKISFDQPAFTLNIDVAKGNYPGAANDRAYCIVFHGLEKAFCINVNGIKEKTIWDADKKILSLFIRKTPVAKKIIITRELKCI